MSLESFIGFDAGEGMSEAAFEAFKEKMKKAAAQIAAIKREEKKHKKKDDELFKLLLKFIRNSSKKDLTTLISRALEQNIPTNFVLAIVLLGNEDIQKEVGQFLMLEGGGAEGESQALIFFTEDQTLPLKARIQMDTWIKNLMIQAEERPEKLVLNAYDKKYKDDEEIRTLKPILPQLTGFVIFDFLSQHNVDEPHTKLRDFAEFIIRGILKKTEESLSNRKLLDS